MRMKLFAFAAMASLLGSSNLNAQRYTAPVSNRVAEVRGEKLGGDSVRLHIAYPALAENEDFQAISYETQDGLVQKLACYIDTTRNQLDTAAVSALFHGVPKTVGDWNAALQAAPQCDHSFNVGPVSSKLSVLTVRPWYEPATMWKMSNLHGDDPTTRYQQDGFGGDLHKLSAQMKEKVPVHWYERIANGDSVRHTEILSVPSFFLKYGQLDTAQTNELVTLLENEKCSITRIPRGMPYYKNTGVRVVGNRRIYDRDEAFLVARCTLKSGRVIDILQYCTNIAHPLMTAEYEFVAVRKPIFVAKVPPPVVPAKPIIPVSSGGFCRGNWKYVCIGVPLLGGAVYALSGHGGSEGNKPVGQPISQY